MAKEPDDFIKKAMRRFKLSADAWKDRRQAWLEDSKFASGEQWNEDSLADRQDKDRPILTINRIPQFINQVTNDQRQNRPSIKVDPVDSKGDPGTAEVFQGLCRHIEVSSAADVAYDTAFSHTATGGFGYWRIVLEYENDESFNQRPVIKSVPNPLMIYPDAHAVESDLADMRYAFVVSQMRKTAFEEKYPKSEMVTSGMIHENSVENMPGWLEESTVRVAEYYDIETKDQNIVLVTDIDGQQRVYPEEQMPFDFIEKVDERVIQVKKVNHYHINGIEKLETSDFPGQWIPLIPCFGQMRDIEGKIQLVGMVRHAKDPQRMINYWTTCLTEQIALSPKPPWIGVEGQFEGHEGKWETANVEAWAYLEYAQVDVGGKLAPPPQRTAIEPAIQAITRALVQSEDQLKAVMGLYDASLGARSNEVSGRAIRARQVEGDTANFHLIDNLARGIRHTGKILVNILPELMPPQTVARIIGDDLQDKAVNVMNEPNGPGFIKGESESDSVYNIGAGKYDVSVEVGPSYRTKREEAASNMLDLVKSWPGLTERAGDVIMSMLDFPMADKLAERLTPPGMGGEDGEEIPPQIQMQIQQMIQEREQMVAQMEQLVQKIQTKEIEQQGKMQLESMKIESQERIEMLKADVAQAKVQAGLLQSNEKMMSQRDMELFKLDYQREMAEVQQSIDLMRQPPAPPMVGGAPAP